MSEKRVTAEQKQAVFERARGCCEYCRSQARFATQSFSIEHIIPRQLGGENTLDNLALACQGCNNHSSPRRRRAILSRTMLCCSTIHDNIGGMTILRGMMILPSLSD